MSTRSLALLFVLLQTLSGNVSPPRIALRYYPDSVTVILTAPSLACVASVSIWFRSKERPVLASREMMCSFTCAIFRAVCDSRSSFFAPRRTETLATQATPSLETYVMLRAARNRLSRESPVGGVQCFNVALLATLQWGNLQEIRKTSL